MLKPQVDLESTVISRDLPYTTTLELARCMEEMCEQCVRSHTPWGFYAES